MKRKRCETDWHSQRRWSTGKKQEKTLQEKTCQDILPKLYFYNIYLKTEIKNVLKSAQEILYLGAPR